MRVIFKLNATKLIASSYGDKFDETKLKALPAGSFYTEPPGRNHFAETGDEAVVVHITGYGPSSTTYMDPAKDPRTRK